MHTSTVSFSHAPMAFFDSSSPEYSHIWQITPKSKWPILTYNLAYNSGLIQKLRVLIATVRDMGGCPCPRCTIKKEDIHALRTLNDSANRHMKVRRDDDKYCATVEEARNNIYRWGYTLNSEPGVECLLKEDSLVPTLVSNSILVQGFHNITLP
jgi:hypothetical protein